MLLQWHRLHTKSVACMSKDINLLPHTAEDTICTWSVSALMTHFVGYKDKLHMKCQWNTVWEMTPNGC